MSTILPRQLTQIKNTAQNVSADVQKKKRIANKIIELKKQYDEVSQKIAGWQAPIMQMTGGYTTEELIIREVTPYLDENGVQKTDKQGNKLTTTKFIPNPDVLTFDEEKRVYILKDKETNENPENPDENANPENANPLDGQPETPYGTLG